MGLLSLGRPKERETFEDVGEVIDVSKDTPVEEQFRAGMDKNHRVGKVISVYHDGAGFKRLLMEVHEWCKDNDGEWYESTYKLLLGVTRKVYLDVVKQLSHGDWVMVGFYFQSFPHESEKNQFVSLAKLRSVHVLRENAVVAAGRSIWEASNQHPLAFMGKYFEL